MIQLSFSAETVFTCAACEFKTAEKKGGPEKEQHKDHKKKYHLNRI